MIYIKLFENFKDDKDFSGDYENSSEFITGNELEDAFIKQYGMYDREEHFDMDEYIRDIGNDEEVIQDFLPNGYRMRYDEDGDFFRITRLKTKKIDIKIEMNTYGKYDSDINEIFETSSILSEYPGRIVAVVGGKAIGVVMAEIIDNEYNFDIVVLDGFQGYGVSKMLIEKLIEDAKSSHVDNITAEVVNDMLGDYLSKIGFEVTGDSHFKVANMEL